MNGRETFHTTTQGARVMDKPWTLQGFLKDHQHLSASHVSLTCTLSGTACRLQGRRGQALNNPANFNSQIRAAAEPRHLEFHTKTVKLCWLEKLLYSNYVFKPSWSLFWVPLQINSSLLSNQPNPGKQHFFLQAVILCLRIWTCISVLVVSSMLEIIIFNKKQK